MPSPPPFVDFTQITTATPFYVYLVTVDGNGTPPDRTDDWLTIVSLVYDPSTFPSTNNQIVHQAQSDGFKDADLQLNQDPTLQVEYVTADHSGFVGRFGNTYYLYSNIPRGPGGQVPIADEPQWDPAATCFLRGTLLQTRGGLVAVEDLRIGDMLRVAGGGMLPIRWIGTSRYAAYFVSKSRNILPVRIRAGALGCGLPERDLLVSPRHCMLFQGALIPAIRLLNGVTITQAVPAEVIAYYHVELDRHDCVLAEGVWTESFLDNGSRFRFHNAATHDGVARGSAVPFPAPLVEGGAELADLLRVLRATTGAQGVGRLAGYVETLDPRVISGWAWDLDYLGRPVILEAVLDGMVLARTVAVGERTDVSVAGSGSAACGFVMTLAEGLVGPTDLERVLVRRQEDHAVLATLPRTLRAAA